MRIMNTQKIETLIETHLIEQRSAENQYANNPQHIYRKTWM